MINNLLKSRNLAQLTLKNYRDIFTLPVKDYYAKIGFDFSVDPFEILGKEWMNEYEMRKTSASVFAEAFEILPELKNAGVKQWLLSAYKHDTLLQIVSHCSIQNYFEEISGLDNIYAGSKLNLAKELMKKINSSDHEVLFIGDTLHDFEVANEIGADCILIAAGHQAKENLLSSGVTVLDSMKNLILTLTNNEKE